VGLAAPSDLETKNKNKKAKRNMKTIIKTTLMTALCCATAFAAPNLKEKHFSGPVRSVETANIDFVTLIMLVDGSGTGKASHLGRFAYTYEFVVDLSTGIGVGSAEFTTANGDSFSTTITALGVPSGTPGVNHVVEKHTIVGGTGRFAGASGSFTLDRLVGTTSTTNLSEGTVDGTIVLDSRHH
jgi:hypothetical protein